MFLPRIFQRNCFNTGIIRVHAVNIQSADEAAQMGGMLCYKLRDEAIAGEQPTRTGQINMMAPKSYTSMLSKTGLFLEI